MKKLMLMLLLCSGSAFAQTGGLIYNDSIVHEIRITTPLTDWIGTLDYDYDQNALDPVANPEIYRSCDVTFDGLPIYNCGFREKGNASNYFTFAGKKKPFKIAFDAFTDQTFDGIKKFNLSNFTNDPSLLHDATCFKLMRDAGIIASRTAYTKLFVNNEYIGLYLIIENVDKTFLKFHYGGANNDGNLYKTDRGVSVFFDWLGEDKAAYKEKGLKLTTNDTVDDWGKLIAFIYFLNNNYDADFKTQLEARFDVHNYLKILAVEKLCRSWDSYWGGGNNFFVYEHPDGMIRWIPWDMNETFQDIKVMSGTSLCDGYLVPANKFDVRPLLKRIFEIPEFKNEYLDNCCSLVQGNFTTGHLGPYLVRMHGLAERPYYDDVYKYNTYGAFSRSLSDDNEDLVTISGSAEALRFEYPGIFPFIQSQREWAVKQMNAWDHNCDIEDNSVYDLFIYPNPAFDHVNISNDQGGFEYAQFRLYDFTGKLYRQTDYDVMSGPSYDLQLAGIPSGIYFLMKHSADGKIGRAKLVIP
ncbi:MAG: CotH kinase family protein [Bacteroidia bacterium]